MGPQADGASEPAAGGPGASQGRQRPGLPVWLRVDGDAVLLLVHLQPGAKRTAIAGEHGGRLKVAVAAPPIEGRANDALLGWLADRLGLPRRRLHIAAGLQARDKTLRVQGIGADELRRRLAGP
jgi:uncharacterized protein (TIGR00251 family)